MTSSILTVQHVAKTLYKRFHSNISNHRNPLISNLSVLNIPGDPGRGLKRKWCRGLLNNKLKTIGWILPSRLQFNPLPLHRLNIYCKKNQFF